MTKKPLKIKAGIKRATKETIIVVIVVTLTLLVGVYTGVYMILTGTSITFSNIVTNTLMETRRGKAIAHLFFSDKELEEIIQANSIKETGAVTDYVNQGFDIPEDEKNDLEIIDVSGLTFNGKMMMVRDPSRIILGVNMLMPDYNNNGYLLEDYVANAGALGGINAGGFDDPGGKGDGSIPYGIVVKDGELISGKLTDYGTIIGFNQHHRLIVGNMTGEQAMEYGMRDAVTFGPVLIVNYEPAVITGTGGGLNPRTVIGQREDGAVLLLVIDGRQPTSLGASYADLINIMMNYGAINAANLDGGSSSVMVYGGEIINSVVSMNGERMLPTAWLVK